MGFSSLFQPRRIWIMLIFITLLGGGLRLWGLDFGLPNLTRPDENHLSKFVMNFILQSFFAGQPDLNPHFFHYPSLFIYLLSVAFGAYYLIGHLLGWFPDGNAFFQMYYSDWSAFHLIQRSLSALFGIASIPAMYLLGSVASRSKRVGLFAAFLLAVTYLHVRDSHFGMTDTTCTFWGILSLWLAVLYYRHGTLKHLYWAAAMAGLAATTKYPCGLVMLSVLAAFYFKQQQQGHTLNDLLSRPPLLKILLLLLLIVFGVFFACSPYIILDFPGFWQDFREQGDAILATNFANMDPGWWYHLRFSFWYGLGALYEITALLSMAWFLLKHSKDRTHWIILLYFVAFFAVNATTRYVFVRYMIPLIPMMALYSAWGCERLANWISQCLHKLPQRRWIGCVLIGMVAAQSLVFSIDIDRIFSQKDTRTLGREWLMAHLKPGEGVGIGLVFTHIDLPPTYNRYFLSPHQSGFVPGQGTPSYIYSPNAEYTEHGTDRHEFNITTYSDVATLKKLGVRYVVHGVVPLPFYRLPQAEIDAVANHPGLKQVAHFMPFNPPEAALPKEAYDQIDGFFIPFSDFGQMQRPGPDIHIYEVMP